METKAVPAQEKPSLKQRIIRIVKHFYKIIGLIIFAIILFRIDFEGIYSVIKEIRLSYLFWLFLPLIITLLLKVLRWHILLSIQGIAISRSMALKIYLTASFIGLATPARLGEFAKIAYIKSHHADQSITKLLINHIIDRGMEFVLILIIAVIGLFCLFTEYSLIIALVLVAILILGNLALVFRKTLIKWASSMAKYILKRKKDEQIDVFIDQLIFYIREFKDKRLIIAVFLNILLYTLFFIAVYWLFLSLRLELPIFRLVITFSLSMLASVLPISIAGIGIRDLILIIFFSQYGITEEQTISFSTLYLFIFLIIPALLGSITYFIISPRNKEGKTKS